MKAYHLREEKSLVLHAEKNNRRKRPRGVTILALLVLYTTIFNLARFYQAIHKWFLLQQFLPFSPLYLIISGLIWGLIGLVIFWILWRGFAWAPKIAIGGITLYMLFFWFDRLLMPSYPQRNANASFYVIVCIVIVFFTVWVCFRTNNKAFFGGCDER